MGVRAACGWHVPLPSSSGRNCAVVFCPLRGERQAERILLGQQDVVSSTSTRLSPWRTPPLRYLPQGCPQRNGRKKARTSCASNAGSSQAAKWPPLGISSQRRIWYDRSPHSRDGRAISWGNMAMPAGAGTLSSLPITHSVRWFSKYIRVEELIVCVTQ